ncbi:hypothetical protein HV99_19605 [Pseudomonas aeruginosa]|nr:hypothetical protein HV99_19605 [Pseudomonas aeruginosa]
MIKRTLYHFHFCCGLGGGAAGFNRARPRVGNVEAEWVCLGGIDVDPAGLRDFERLAGVPGTLLDLFTRDQYVRFHGKEPPAGWREATPEDIRRAAGGRRPDAVFISSPCKGASGLLSEKMSLTPKYQALNELTLRCIWLMGEAWADDPVPLIVFENVPRLASRGRHLLDQIKDQAPARSEASFEEWLANELEGEDGQPVPAAVCDIALARRAFNHWPNLEKPAQVGAIRFHAGLSSRLVVEAAQRAYEYKATPEQEAERIERLQAFREQLDPLNLAPHAGAFNEAPAEALKPEQAEAERPEVVAHVDGSDEDWFIQPEDETELHNEGLLFAGCDYCGGTGFRSVCNKTVCHEYGCSHGTCVATRQEFEAWERRRSGSKEVGHE